MTEETTSLPSVDTFLTVCTKALPVLRNMNTSSRASVLSMKRYRRVLYGDEVISCIEELEGEAIKLKDLQGIVRPFVGVDLPFHVNGGLLSAGTRNGRYTPEAYLKSIRAVFDEWTYRGRRASELRCADGFVLYNLAHEFQSFERAAKALNTAQSAGSALLNGAADDALEKRVKRSLRKVVDFRMKEFAEITERGADRRKSHFVLAKRTIYNDNFPDLKRLSDLWDADAQQMTLLREDADNYLGDHVINWLKSVTLEFFGNDRVMPLAARVTQEYTNSNGRVLDKYCVDSLPKVVPGNEALIGSKLKQMLKDLTETIK